MRFASICQELLGGKIPQKLALAVSGGVDSMAMAYLAREALPDTKLTTITIDHGARDGSDKEARHVQSQLIRMGLDDCQVLKLGENFGSSAHLPEKSRFELNARNARAQLFYAACQSSMIDHLMLAHTRDDQLETFIMRLIMGSGPTGLAGIRSVNRSPVLAPPGKNALTYLRPVLQYSKAELENICMGNSIKWVEDITNYDPNFTVRNAIRHMIKQTKEPQEESQREGLLPGNLDPDTIHEYMKHLQHQREMSETKANSIIWKMLTDGLVDYDSQLGIVTLNGNVFEMGVTDKHVKALVLLKIIEPIIPIVNHYYKLSDLENLVADPSSSSAMTKMTGTVKTMSNLRFDCRDASKWVITRQRPYNGSRNSVPSLTIPVSEIWSQWQLFDNRMWMRAKTNPKSLQSHPKQPQKLTISYSKNPALDKHILSSSLPKIPFNIFQIQPAAYVHNADADDMTLLAYPTLAPIPGIDFEFQYKQPEIDVTTKY